LTRTLVTGLTGFIGGHLVRALLNRGYDVRGFDNFESGDRESVAELEDCDGFEFLDGDLRDASMVAEAVADIDQSTTKRLSSPYRAALTTQWRPPRSTPPERRRS
jgi:nucleoside-diphosphate-sugar epimerase